MLRSRIHYLQLAFLAAAATLVLTGVPRAAMYDIDATHSSVGFEVRHLFSLVPGSFNSFSGTIGFDAAAPEKSTASLTIQAASVDTRNEKRDGHLQSPDFFDAARCSTITFASTGIEKTDRKDVFRMHGDLTLRCVTRPVVLEVTVLGSGPDGFGGIKAGFHITGTIDRKDFGISWNKALDNDGTLLGDEVTLDIPIEAVKKSDS